MSESRRGFLAKCLGGVALTLPALAETASTPPQQSPKSPPKSQPGPVFNRPGTTLEVHTDFLPAGTDFILGDGRHLMFINELLIWFRPGRSTQWVGLNTIIPGNGFKPSGGKLVPTLFYGSPNRNGDVLPEVRGHDGIRLPLMLHSLHVDAMSCLSFAFLVGYAAVKLTKPLSEYDLRFFCCPRCGAYQRALGFTQEERRQGSWICNCDKDVDYPPCSKCGHRFDDSSPSMPFDENKLYKAYITPTTSHLVFEPGEAADPAAGPQFSFGEVDANNHPAWLAKETASRPIAQLLPKPSYLNEFFLKAWAPLFGGVTE